MSTAIRPREPLRDIEDTTCGRTIDAISLLRTVYTALHSRDVLSDSAIDGCRETVWFAIQKLRMVRDQLNGSPIDDSE